MPIYEYQCQKCKAHTEVLQKITDKPLTKCRKCGGRLEKQWSQAGIQFKGSGWYVTDYAGKKAGKEDKKAGEEKPADTPDAKATDKAATTDAPASKKSAEKKSTARNTTSSE